MLTEVFWSFLLLDPSAVHASPVKLQVLTDRSPRNPALADAFLERYQSLTGATLLPRPHHRPDHYLLSI